MSASARERIVAAGARLARMSVEDRGRGLVLLVDELRVLPGGPWMMSLAAAVEAVLTGLEIEALPDAALEAIADFVLLDAELRGHREVAS